MTNPKIDAWFAHMGARFDDAEAAVRARALFRAAVGEAMADAMVADAQARVNRMVYAMNEFPHGMERSSRIG